MALTVDTGKVACGSAQRYEVRLWSVGKILCTCNPSTWHTGRAIAVCVPGRPCQLELQQTRKSEVTCLSRLDSAGPQNLSYVVFCFPENEFHSLKKWFEGKQKQKTKTNNSCMYYTLGAILGHYIPMIQDSESKIRHCILLSFVQDVSVAMKYRHGLLGGPWMVPDSLPSLSLSFLSLDLFTLFCECLGCLYVCAPRGCRGRRGLWTGV